MSAVHGFSDQPVWFIIAIAVVVIIQVVRFVREQKHETTEEHKLNVSDGGYGSARLLVNEVRAYRQAQKRQNYRRYFGDTLTLVILIVAAGIATLQWAALERTDETNRVGLRPYISATALQIDTERMFPMWEFGITLENSGGTPPIGLTYLIRSSPEVPPDPEETYRHPTQTDFIWYATVAPKGKITLPYGGGMMGKWFEDRKYWYISGVIHYRDRFMGTPDRITKFCFAAVGGINYSTKKTVPAYDVCKYWNCVDEEDCKADRERYDRDLRALNPHLNKPPQPK